MTRKQKIIVIVMAALVVISAAIIIIRITVSDGNDAQGPDLLKETIMLNGIRLDNLCSYTGNYVEDGSNDSVSNILSAMITNCSSEALEYAKLELSYGGERYEFAVSALPAGKTVQALEMNRKSCPDISDDVQANLEYLVFNDEPLSLCEDKLDISGTKGGMTVSNVSDTDIGGTITVCYKNISDDGYLGGIAYRISIPNGLAAGASAKLGIEHYDPKTCEIIFVSYGE